jgi:hypothetical protein
LSTDDKNATDIALVRVFPPMGQQGNFPRDYGLE